ncbi:SAM-dependent methyltransferase [Streptomyces sp. NPDC050704]|uniref:SAM-dependent methyltransferase n=1 Tax=Streptomyces sp. NPDC050704 TaxID=3157219 RepID=UPI003434E5BA
MARLLCRVDEALGRPAELAFVDMGAGRGELLTGVLKALPAEVASRARGYAVERAGRPRDLDHRIEWLPVPPAGVTGLLFANEWLDNVPLDVAEADADGVPRLVLVREDGTESLGEPVTGAEADWLARWWPLGRAPGASGGGTESGGVHAGPEGLGGEGSDGRRASSEVPGGRPTGGESAGRAAEPLGHPGADDTDRPSRANHTRGRPGTARPDTDWESDPAPDPDPDPDPDSDQDQDPDGRRGVPGGPAAVEFSGTPAAGEFSGAPGDPGAPGAPGDPDHHDPPPAEGLRAEIGLPRDAAWASAVAALGRGLAVAVDYAHFADARPPFGTLTGFREGRETAPVPDGSCDITAHVALDACALPGARLLTQREALRALGVSGERPPLSLAATDPTAYVRALAGAGEAAELTAPGGLGDFGWLVQPVGIANPLPGGAPLGAPPGALLVDVPDHEEQ